MSEWHPVTGPYAALAQSGSFRLIQNPLLRGLLETYDGELHSTEGALARIEFLAVRNLGETNRLLPYDQWAVLRKKNALGHPEAARFAESVRRNPEVRVLLRDDRAAALGGYAILKPLRAQTTKLRQALESELHEKYVNVPLCQARWRRSSTGADSSPRALRQHTSPATLVG